MRTLLSSIAIVCLCAWNTFAQSYTISTYAGPAAPVPGAQAVTQALDAPYAVVADGRGGVYVASVALNRVLHVQSDGRLFIIAGTGTPGFSGDGGPATEARLDEPRGLAVDAAGNIYISDALNHRIRRVSPNGIINTIAGTGIPGFSGDGGRPPAAQLNSPRGLAVDAAGNLFIVDSLNLRVRSVTAAGAMTTVAGNGQPGSGGDGGSATAASFNFGIEGVAVDPNGVLYIADTLNHRIRRVVRGVIQPVAGTGTSGFSGDGGPATAAQLFSPAGVSFAAGNLYISDSRNQRIRMVDSAGNINTVAGTGQPGGLIGDGGPALSARLANPGGLSVDALGNLFIADFSSNRVRRVSSNGVIDTFAGNGTEGYSGDGGQATLAQLRTPYGIATDTEGNLFIADLNNHRIRKVTPAGVITTVAGNGFPGFSGDGGPATSGQIRSPSDVAVDFSGNLYIADTGNLRVRRVTSNGTISTFAGSGVSGYAGDDGPALLARFNAPVGLAVDRTGNVFISDLLNHRIRRVTQAGIITTVAGDGTAGFDGDGEAATNAQLNTPYGLTVDAAGTLFIADTLNHRIRRVGSSGIIDTIVGSGTLGFSGDNNFAGAAQLNNPSGVSVDSEGNLFIADTFNNRIRKVDRGGVITTIAGFTPGFRGDGGPANAAWLSLPRRVIATSTGNLFIADTINHRIRELAQPKLIAGAYTIADRGGSSLLSSGTAALDVLTGFASIEPDGGRTTPAGLAIFGFRQRGVLVSEAAVPATSLIQSGRIYGEVRSSVNTGLALANPNFQDATITFFFTDQNGDSAQSNLTLAARSQIAAFLDQAPFNGPASLAGSFTFNSSIPIAAIALRGFTNERSEFLLTTLPVIDLASTAPGSNLLPHFADGAGWTSEVVLVNPGDSVLTGSIQFFGRSGQAIAVGLNGPASYSISPRSSGSVRTTGLPAITETGWVKIVPAASSSSPVAFAVFSYRRNGIVVSEAGVPSVPAASAFRLYAESFGNFSQGEAGSIQSGLAVANPTSVDINIFVEVQNMDGSTGLIGTVSVPANGQTSLYLNQIPGLQFMLTPYQGVLRLSSSAAFSVIGLRGRYNERGDPLVTTTSPVSENAPPSNTPTYFPHLADSGGYTTQFIVFSGYARQTSTGFLRFFNQSGVALNLGFR